MGDMKKKDKPMTVHRYIRVGIMLNAVDQRQPPNRPALLPPLDR